MDIKNGVRGDDLQLNSGAKLGKLKDDISFPKHLRPNQQTVMANDEN